MGLENYFADCYVLSAKRDIVTVTKFLDHFLAMPVVLDDYLVIPQYAQYPKLSFNNYEDLIKYLEGNLSEKYYLIFSGFNIEKTNPIFNSLLKKVTDETIDFFRKHLLCKCFFTNDGRLILGISCPILEDSNQLEVYFFSKLKEVVQSVTGYITYEQPAPMNSERFLEIAGKWENDNTYYENINE